MGISEDTELLSSRLGLPKGFYWQLIHEDDWSFVIKLHALFEAAVTYILTEKLGNPGVQRTIARLPMSDSEAGKLTLISDLKILTRGQLRFVRALSKLRNDLVHRIENVNFSFKTYVSGLDKNQRREFVANAGRGVVDEPEFAGVKVPKSKFVLDNPKVGLWLSASEVLACIRIEEETIQLDQKQTELDAVMQFLNEQNNMHVGLLKLPTDDT